MLEIIAYQQNLAQRTRPANLFDVLSYDQEQQYYFLSDGSIGVALALTPLKPELAGSAVDKLKGLFDLQGVSNMLLQIILLSRFTGSDDESNAAVCERHEEGILTIKFPCQASLPDDEEIEKIICLKIQAQTILTDIGMRPRELMPDDYLRIMRSLMHVNDKQAAMEFAASEYDETKLIRDQIISSSGIINVTQTGLWLNSIPLSTLSVNRYPDYMSLKSTARYLGNATLGWPLGKSDLLITLNIAYSQDDKDTKKEEEPDEIIDSIYAPLYRYTPPLEIKGDGYQVVYKGMHGQDNAIRCNLNFCVFGQLSSGRSTEQRHEHEQHVRDLIAYFQKLGLQLQDDQYIALPLLFNALPFGAHLDIVDDLMRYRAMSCDDTVNMFPVLGRPENRQELCHV